MTDRPDYKAMTIEDLQVVHAALCALAHDNQQTIPDELTIDFDDAEAGANICRQVHNLLDDAGVEVQVAKGDETVQDGPASKTKKARAKKVAPQQQESKVEKTKTAKKTATKKVAKKSKSKKVAAKKTTKGNGAAKKARAPKGTGPVAEVVKMLQSAKGCTRAQILAKTGWKAVSVQQIAEGAGLKLKVDESKRPFTYKAT